MDGSWLDSSSVSSHECSVDSVCSDVTPEKSPNVGTVVWMKRATRCQIPRSDGVTVVVLGCDAAWEVPWGEVAP